MRIRGAVIENPIQPPCIGVGQRGEQNASDRAEDRGIRPDAEGEREHGYRGKPGRLHQIAQRVLHRPPVRPGFFGRLIRFANIRKAPGTPSGSCR